MSQANKIQPVDDAVSVSREERKHTIELDLILFERRGRCFVRYYNNSLAELNNGYIRLYEGDATKAHPRDSIASIRDTEKLGDGWDTGKSWGSGYSAGWTANDVNQDQVLVFATPVTKRSAE